MHWNEPKVMRQSPLFSNITAKKFYSTGPACLGSIQLDSRGASSSIIQNFVQIIFQKASTRPPPLSMTFQFFQPTNVIKVSFSTWLSITPKLRFKVAALKSFKINSRSSNLFLFHSHIAAIYSFYFYILYWIPGKATPSPVSLSWPEPFSYCLVGD